MLIEEQYQNKPLISMTLSREKHEDILRKIQLKHSSMRVKALTSLQWGPAGIASADELSATQGLTPGILLGQTWMRGKLGVLKNQCRLLDSTM